MAFKISIDQIYTVTTDNGSNMLKAIRILSSEYEDSDVDIVIQEDEDENIDRNEDNEHEIDDLNVLEEMETDFTDINVQNNILTGNNFSY